MENDRRLGKARPRASGRGLILLTLAGVAGPSLVGSSAASGQPATDPPAAPPALALPQACRTITCLLDGQVALQDNSRHETLFRTAVQRGASTTESLTVVPAVGKSRALPVGDPARPAGAARRRKLTAKLEKSYNEFAPVVHLPRRVWPPASAAVMLEDLGTRIDWQEGKLRLSGPGLRQPLEIPTGFPADRAHPQAVYAAPASDTLLVLMRVQSGPSTGARPTSQTISGVVVALPLDRKALFQRNLTRLPQAAASVVAAIHAAASIQDWKHLRSGMKNDFTHSFGGDNLADQAIESWRQDPQAMPALVGVLEKGCQLEAEQTKLRCDGEGGASRRAGFELSPLGWRFAYFVQGD